LPSKPGDDRKENVMPALADARVLVIDDDPDVREFIVNYLTELGLEASEAQDGESGLALLERVEPDLLLVDFAMPGLNGAEVAKRAKARYPKLPIVFITGYADTASIEAAMGLRALILRKPFLTYELQAMMSLALRPES
jgi:CheY-like chemotaxis protein